MKDDKKQLNFDFNEKLDLKHASEFIDRMFYYEFNLHYLYVNNKQYFYACNNLKLPTRKLNEIRSKVVTLKSKDFNIYKNYLLDIEVDIDNISKEKEEKLFLEGIPLILLDIENLNFFNITKFMVNIKNHNTSLLKEEKENIKESIYFYNKEDNDIYELIDNLLVPRDFGDLYHPLGQYGKDCLFFGINNTFYTSISKVKEIRISGSLKEYEKLDESLKSFLNRKSPSEAELLINSYLATKDPNFTVKVKDTKNYKLSYLQHNFATGGTKEVESIREVAHVDVFYKDKSIIGKNSPVGGWMYCTYTEDEKKELKMVYSAWCQRSASWTKAAGYTDQLYDRWELFNWLSGPFYEKYRTETGTDLFDTIKVVFEGKKIVSKENLKKDLLKEMKKAIGI